MHEKIIISLIILLIVVALSSACSQSKQSDISNKYSLTKAICDKNKTCQDFYIECNGSKVLNLTVVTGLVTFEEDWIDKTNTSNGLCYNK